MEKQEIFEGVRQVCKTILRMPAESIEMNSRLVADLNLNSLYLTDLAIELEDFFSIEIDDGDMSFMETIADTVDYIHKKKNR